MSDKKTNTTELTDDQLENVAGGLKIDTKDSFIKDPMETGLKVTMEDDDPVANRESAADSVIGPAPRSKK